MYQTNFNKKYGSLQNLILGRQRQPETTAAAPTTSAAAATSPTKQCRQPVPTTTPSIPAASSASFALRATATASSATAAPPAAKTSLLSPAGQWRISCSRARKQAANQRRRPTGQAAADQPRYGSTHSRTRPESQPAKQASCLFRRQPGVPPSCQLTITAGPSRDTINSP